MLTYRSLSADVIQAFLARQRALPLSYHPAEITRGPAPVGYTVDHRRHRLGTGPDAFDRACAGLRTWAQFRQVGLRLEPAGIEPAVGAVVAVVARVGPCW